MMWPISGTMFETFIFVHEKNTLMYMYVECVFNSFCSQTFGFTVLVRVSISGYS